ncbi:hypothetical protein K3M67_06430 [Sphingobium sp. V4]|uniref:hypothetical protein n=1 Tax=Sphingobium sp. V4 TaxID=3038927 RepID=UPI002557FFAB|nr:hypothetical protein [Sphingobium sp. V4]WIW89591.1 hypothetical protein K3M67_06430 [Sphingobium sp. V4]
MTGRPTSVPAISAGKRPELEISGLSRTLDGRRPAVANAGDTLCAFTNSIHGTFSVPDGSAFLPDSENLIRLPGGQIISIHPIIEMAGGPDSDDHRNLSYDQAAALDVLLEDYDRSSVPW